jgi:hypothetical protein
MARADGFFMSLGSAGLPASNGGFVFVQEDLCKRICGSKLSSKTRTMEKNPSDALLSKACPVR